MKIIASCESAFHAHRTDTIGFLEVVAAQYLTDLSFIRDSADETVCVVEDPAGGWISLGTDTASAIDAATSGQFVIACMSAAEFVPARAEGHVAIVVGLKGAKSNKKAVPICYAGSKRGPAAYGLKASMAFPAADAQQGRIRYFSRNTDHAPSEHPF